jgi:membrane peptidoglycan carboxypeptidase
MQGTGRAFSLLAAFLATSVVAGVLGAGLLMPAAGVTGTLARNGVDFFDSLPEELSVQPMSQQSRILYADGTPMATFFYENRIAVPLSSVAPTMRQAVIAIEDSRFYEHGGADAKGIMRAMLNNASGGDTQGASTLTQQWVKNVLLEQAIQDGDKEMQAALQNPNKGRKLREIKLAISAEKRLTKDEILQNYLNIALFGDGQYGVETAARHYFSKKSSDLALQDAALLAGMLQGPSRYDPVAHPEAALQRRNTVLARMLQLGMISQEQHDAAAAVPLEEQLKVQKTQNGCEQAGIAGFFCDYVTKVVLNNEAFGKDVNDRKRLLYRGGLTITTTLDRNMQKQAYDTINAKVPAKDSSGVGGSIVSVQPGTGHILAMAQNRVYNPRSEAGVDATSINYNTSFQYGGSRGFQPGSTFKPLVLATWLKSGRSLNDTVDARKKTFPNSVWKMPCFGRYTSPPWGPQNAGDGMGSGHMRVLEATYNSVNTAYAEMESKLNLCDIQKTASSLGVFNAYSGKPVAVRPSMVLGVEEVAPVSMAGAFAAFGAQGTFCKPTAILKVTDANDKELPIPPSDCAAALTPDIANGVTSALENTLIKGTARGLGIGRPAAGKTGTTNDNVATWFVGYTPQVATAVWLGHPGSSKTLNGSTIDGKRYRKMYGATLSAPIWHDYMAAVHKGLPVKDFPKPSSKIQYGEKVSVPNVVGKSVDSAVKAIQDVGLTATVSGSMNSDVPKGRVAGTQPGSGSSIQVGSSVTVVVSDGPAPQPTQTTPPPDQAQPPSTAPNPGDGGKKGKKPPKPPKQDN